MITTDSIYEYLMESLLVLLRDLDSLDKDTVKQRLSDITDHGELLHSYLAFRAKNEALESQGKPVKQPEAVFDSQEMLFLSFFLKHES